MAFLWISASLFSLHNHVSRFLAKRLLIATYICLSGSASLVERWLRKGLYVTYIYPGHVLALNVNVIYVPTGDGESRGAQPSHPTQGSPGPTCPQPTHQPIAEREPSQDQLNLAMINKATQLIQQSHHSVLILPMSKNKYLLMHVSEVLWLIAMQPFLWLQIVGGCSRWHSVSVH